MNNLEPYLKQYFAGLKSPKLSTDEKKVLVEELTRLIEILQNNPNISYSDLWDKIHEL